MGRISLIVAMDQNRLIGKDGGLPWRLPNDLQHFKRHTVGKTVLMGRRTWDDIKKPLPNRENWVLTRDANFSAPGARIFAKLDDALSAHTEGELMVIGGAQLYAQTLPLAHRLILTQVEAQVEGDTWFPEWDASRWREVSREAHPADERHAHAYSFITLERA